MYKEQGCESTRNDKVELWAVEVAPHCPMIIPLVEYAVSGWLLSGQPTNFQPGMNTEKEKDHIWQMEWCYFSKVAYTVRIFGLIISPGWLSGSLVTELPCCAQTNSDKGLPQIVKNKNKCPKFMGGTLPKGVADFT